MFKREDIIRSFSLEDAGKRYDEALNDFACSLKNGNAGQIINELEKRIEQQKADGVQLIREHVLICAAKVAFNNVASRQMSIKVPGTVGSVCQLMIISLSLQNIFAMALQYINIKDRDYNQKSMKWQSDNLILVAQINAAVSFLQNEESQVATETSAKRKKDGEGESPDCSQAKCARLDVSVDTAAQDKCIDFGANYNPLISDSTTSEPSSILNTPILFDELFDDRDFFTDNSGHSH